MSDHGDADGLDSTQGGLENQADPEGVATVESYEVEGGVVFYDAENPLAWVEATTALHLREQA